jgi:hypothetical protein
MPSRRVRLRYAGCSIEVALGRLEIPPVWANSRRTVDAPASARNGGSQAARCFGWSGPYGEEFAPDKSASATTNIPGRAAHGERERYLAKECVGSNRIGKERSQLPAATTTETKPEERTNSNNAGFNTTNKPQKTRRPGQALPLRTNPEGNRFCLTNSFRKVRPTAGSKRDFACVGRCRPTQATKEIIEMAGRNNVLSRNVSCRAR